MLKSRYQDYTTTTTKVNVKKQHNPVLLVVAGYLALILVGAILLFLPFTHHGELSFIDALFTATSATCVTGLSTVEIASTFTGFGHWVLVVLMQTGGLGIMTISTVIILLAGMHPGFTHQSVLLSSFTQEGNINPVRILKAVIPFTLILEVLGMVSFFTQFTGLSLYDRIFYSIFHGVSGFCNVGFTLFPDSFVGFRTNPVINVTTSILVLAGSFGFLAITELRYLFDFKARTVRKISLHTRVAVMTMIILILMGFGAFLLVEWNGILAGQSVSEKLFSAFFMSTVSRTAGFNTVDIPSLHVFSLFFIFILMLIGANPGSCGGGIKTTTSAIIALIGFNRILGRQKTQVQKRTIPEETVDKAVRLFIAAIAIIVVATLVLLLTEGKKSGFNGDDVSFLKVFFEAASAYSTCGLSMGLTTELSTAGRIVICLVMFIGRMGPLFLISAVSKKQDERMWYAEEDIMVG